MKKFLKNKKVLLLCIAIFGVLSGVSTTAIAILLQQIIDFATSGNADKFSEILKITIMFFLGMGLAKYIYSLTGKILIKNVTKEIRSNLFEGLMKKNNEEFSSQNTANYISLFTNDIKFLEENYLLPMLLVIQNSIIFISALVVLTSLSKIITLSLISCLLVMFTVPGLFGKSLQRRQANVSNEASNFTEKTKDLLSGFEVIKSYNIEPASASEFREKNNIFANIKFSFDCLLAVNEAVSELIAMSTIFVVIFIGAFQVLNKQISLGTLIALVQLSSIFISPVVIIMQNIPKMKSVKPIVTKITDIIETQDTENLGLKIDDMYNKISLKNLDYVLNENKKILSNININFEKGKKYAIVGPSGSGKSTLVNVLTTAYENYGGSYSIDGEEVKELNKKKVKEIFSTIHQKIYLFNSTVYHNICLNHKYKESVIYDAMERSGVDEFINKNYRDLQKLVGENGSNLSGGQRQRIAVARALIRKKTVLILDEGTSSLDMKTASEIEADLLKLEDLTLIVVTHKLDSEMLRKYDEVIFMKDKEIVSHGKYDSLLEENHEFNEFCNIQSKVVCH